ncbi:hypothetical protein KSS82_09900 [Vibrio mimicus]|nr:hypothetical protein [Vibrio mimicus]QXC58363.1 hypothetical protein KSS82_09900 [Vibrio mimicus]
MKISLSALTAMTILLTTSASANDDKSQILEQLKLLQQQGTTQASTYQYSDTTQLTQCADNAQPFRDQAKQLQKTILESNDVVFRMPAYQAADLAFQCVYCSENAISYCEKMTKYITRVEKALAK